LLLLLLVFDVPDISAELESLLLLTRLLLLLLASMFSGRSVITRKFVFFYEVTLRLYGLAKWNSIQFNSKWVYCCVMVEAVGSNG
jgi:hypothetical protein